MDIINIQGMKGGSGTTTIAVALAALLHNNTNLRIAIHANHHRSDVNAVAGVPRGENVFQDGIMFCPTDDALDPHRWDVVIVDNGHVEDALLSEPNPHGKTHNIYVVRADYLSLRRTVALPREDFDPEAVWVIRTNSEAALGVRDARDVLDLKAWNTVEIPDDPKIARAVDAGVLVRRVPSSLNPLIRTVSDVFHIVNDKEWSN